MDRSRTFLQVKELFESLQKSYALVGGLAVSIRARERFTRDIDFAVAVGGDDEAEELARSFQQQGFIVLDALEQTQRKRLATLRFSLPGAYYGARV